MFFNVLRDPSCVRRASGATAAAYGTYLSFFWDRVVAWREFEDEAGYSLDVVGEPAIPDPSVVSFLAVRRQRAQRAKLDVPAPFLLRMWASDPPVVAVSFAVEQEILEVVEGDGRVPEGRVKAPYVAVVLTGASRDEEGGPMHVTFHLTCRHDFEILTISEVRGDHAEDFREKTRAAGAARARGFARRRHAARAGGPRRRPRTCRCASPSTRSRARARRSASRSRSASSRQGLSIDGVEPGAAPPRRVGPGPRRPSTPP